MLALLKRTLGHTSCYVFPSNAAMECHVEHVPALRSRELACPEDGNRASTPSRDPALILDALRRARTQMDMIAADHAELTRQPDLLDAISADLGNRQDITSRVRENLLVRGRDTDRGPVVVAPKLFLSKESVHRLLRDKAGSGGTPLAGVLRKLALQVPVRRNIRPSQIAGAETGMRVALHGHYFYPELLDELLESLSVNLHTVNLHLSTDTEVKRTELESIVSRRRIAAEIRVFPNRGRDVAPCSPASAICSNRAAMMWWATSTPRSRSASARKKATSGEDRYCTASSVGVTG
jgi:hypothetical protein